MEKKIKKRYQKPDLKGAVAFEAAAAICCVATAAACTQIAKGGKIRTTSGS